MENPYQSPGINVDISHKMPKEIPYIKSWLLFFLMSSVVGGLIGMFLGAITGSILGKLGMSMLQITYITAAIGFFISIPISLFSFRWSVKKYIVTPITNRDL